LTELRVSGASGPETAQPCRGFECDRRGRDSHQPIIL
jgi:hypothetical protein